VVGYDVMTRRVTGRLVPEDADESFLRPREAALSEWKKAQTIVTPRAVYYVERNSPDPRLFYQAAEEDQVLAASEPSVMDETEAVVVVTERRIVLVAASGPIIWDIANEPGPPDYALIFVYSLVEPNEYGVFISPSYRASHQSGWKLPSHVVLVSGLEGARRHVELPPLPFPQYAQDWLERVFGFVFPPLLVLRLGQGLVGVGEILPLGLGGALVWVLVGWGIGRRRGVSVGRQAAWAGFHLLFGLPGLLASLGVQEWPVRELCPECNKKRPIDEEKCRHCGAGFAPPERNGTEIFEPVPGQPAESR
jgi:hypothetical protein